MGRRVRRAGEEIGCAALHRPGAAGQVLELGAERPVLALASLRLQSATAEPGQPKAGELPLSRPWETASNSGKHNFHEYVRITFRGSRQKSRPTLYPARTNRS